MNAINFSESVSKSVIKSMGTGKDSQCVEFQTPSGQTTAGCFEVSCNKDASKYKIIFQRDKALEINCSYETVGNQIQVGIYMVKCVDPESICRNRNTKCPFDCFYRGKCRESGICTVSYTHLTLPTILLV